MPALEKFGRGLVPALEKFRRGLEPALEKFRRGLETFRLEGVKRWEGQAQPTDSNPLIPNRRQSLAHGRAQPAQAISSVSPQEPVP